MADSYSLNILLADDDSDDCLFFKDVLDGLPLPTFLTTVHNGEQLMEVLLNSNELPDILFLDLNMPRKNGFECLSEIKQNKKLNQIPVIIFSTSLVPDVVALLYKNGAKHYVCKPDEYGLLLKVLRQVVTLTPRLSSIQPSIKDFVLSPESCFNVSAVDEWFRHNSH